MNDQPTDASVAIWRDYVASHTRIMRAIETELKRDHGLTLAQYDVLLNLWTAPKRRLRMSELAQAVQYSSGAATKLIAPLVKAGLVSRVVDESDRRSAHVTLTSKGRRVFVRAGRDHLPAIQREFAQHLPARDAEVIGSFLRRIAEG